MAALCRTGIRCAQFGAQVGTGNTQTVVGPIVRTHIDPPGHMTFDTEIAVAWLALIDLLVKVVFFTVIDFSPVALAAEIVAVFVEFEAVHVVTVAALYAMLIHLALHE